MDAAKASMKKVLGRSGQHDTTVHEQVAPAVQNETITKTEHEREQAAVDREVHTHHHHTTEQPIQHEERLAEQHHHTEVPMEHREFDHRNDEGLNRGLEQERSQYRDTQTRVEGERTRETGDAVVGEHRHHHVHETIQPVVNKQTHEHHVLHKTVPIHEVHHTEGIHHASHSLPPVSMEDFKKQGGSLGGREEKMDHFPGEPKAFPGEDGMHGRTATTGTTGTTMPATSTTTGTTGSSGNFGTMEEERKPSLMDKLNPKKDTTGDGKPGVMS